MSQNCTKIVLYESKDYFQHYRRSLNNFEESFDEIRNIGNPGEDRICSDESVIKIDSNPEESTGILRQHIVVSLPLSAISRVNSISTINKISK